jgi:glutaconate CoA-transferase subunit A
MGYTTRDNAFYTAWDAISRDRDRFLAWVERFVLSTDGFDEYLGARDDGTLMESAGA